MAAGAKTLVCIGDSIVAGEGDTAGRGGWVGRLRERLPFDGGKSGWSVHGLGIGGNTIRDIELRLGEVLARDPDVVVLGCATNDVVEYPENGPEGNELHPKLTEHNRQHYWRSVLHKLRAVCPQVLVTPGVFMDREYIDPVNGRGAHRATFEAHLAFIEQACREAGVEYVGLAAEPFGGAGLRNHDLHWNAQGYDLLATLIEARLTGLGWV